MGDGGRKRYAGSRVELASPSAARADSQLHGAMRQRRLDRSERCLVAVCPFAPAAAMDGVADCDASAKDAAGASARLLDAPRDAGPFGRVLPPRAL